MDRVKVTKLDEAGMVEALASLDHGHGRGLYTGRIGPASATTIAAAARHFAMLVTACPPATGFVHVSRGYDVDGATLRLEWMAVNRPGDTLDADWYDRWIEAGGDHDVALEDRCMVHSALLRGFIWSVSELKETPVEAQRRRARQANEALAARHGS